MIATPTSRGGDVDLARLSDGLANYSMSTSSAKRVVVPPGTLEAMGDAALRAALREQRAVNDRLMTNVIAAKQNVMDGFAAVGLTAPQSVSGRVTRPK